MYQFLIIIQYHIKHLIFCYVKCNIQTLVKKSISKHLLMAHFECQPSNFKYEVIRYKYILIDLIFQCL